MKIKSSAPRGKDVRVLVHQITLTAEDEAEERLLSELRQCALKIGLYRTLTEGLGIEGREEDDSEWDCAEGPEAAAPPADGRGSEEPKP